MQMRKTGCVKTVAMASVVVMALTLMSGCQMLHKGQTSAAQAGPVTHAFARSSELSRLTLGMSREDTLQQLGRPAEVSADADSDEEHLLYRMRRHALCLWRSEFDVVLRHGKLVRYGPAGEVKDPDLAY